MLETERLVLRDLTLGDLDELAALYRDPEVRRYFPEGTLTYEETREELEWCIDVYDARYGYGLWATVRKDRDELIGRCGLLPWRATETPEGELVLEAADEHPVDGATYEIELAYLLGREHWGLGLATEAARAIVRPRPADPPAPAIDLSFRSAERRLAAGRRAHGVHLRPRSPPGRRAATHALVACREHLHPVGGSATHWPTGSSRAPTFGAEIRS